jgi:hypothetical protein
MAKLITKFKYLKPDRKQSAGGYAKYIATREGVECVDDSKKYAPVTQQQKNLIEKVIKDFPDSKEMFEYQDYLNEQTLGSASDFLSRVMEDYGYEIEGRKAYAGYIALRPRAERFGSHGLFTYDGVKVNLSKVKEELDSYDGNIWTAIISLRREDAERLGFNNADRWRTMLRSQAGELAENMKIPMDNLRWYAAFHNESHHPHVHLIMYSTEPKEGYLTKKGLENLRSSIARSVFKQNLISVYEKQTEHRDMLKVSAKDIVAGIVASINADEYGNQTVENLLKQLADKLSRTSGKKVYGYLKSDVKNIVDEIVRELSSDERISELYGLWYEQKEATLRTYSDEIPKRIPLVDNKEFKSIKNAVIKEALKLNLNQETVDDELVTIPPYSLKNDDETIIPTLTAETQSTQISVKPCRRRSFFSPSISLLRYLCGIIQNRIREDKDREYQRQVDRKIRRKIEDKKQGLGLH